MFQVLIVKSYKYRYFEGLFKVFVLLKVVSRKEIYVCRGLSRKVTRPHEVPDVSMKLKALYLEFEYRISVHTRPCSLYVFVKGGLIWILEKYIMLCTILVPPTGLLKAVAIQAIIKQHLNSVKLKP